MGKTLRKWVDPIGSKKKGKEELKKKEDRAINSINLQVNAAKEEAEAEKAKAEEEETSRRRAAYATSRYRYSRGENQSSEAKIKRKTLLG